MTSELDINQTNANTWHWTDMEGLPKRFLYGIIPVAATSLHKNIQCTSSHSEVRLKLANMSGICRHYNIAKPVIPV